MSVLHMGLIAFVVGAIYTVFLCWYMCKPTKIEIDESYFESGINKD